VLRWARFSPDMPVLPAWAQHDSVQDVWTLHVHAQPGASRNEIVGEHGGRLKLKITAPAVDNKANACLVEFLAKLLGVARSQIKIIRGQGARQKTLTIQGAGAALAELITQEENIKSKP
jgi:uncharacterized protein